MTTAYARCLVVVQSAKPRVAKFACSPALLAFASAIALAAFLSHVMRLLCITLCYVCEYKTYVSGQYASDG
jgi:hypothetical protein